MYQRSVFKAAFSVASVVLLGMVFFSYVARAESYPEFNQKYWEDERAKAKGKIWRGAALGALGVASIAPTTILTIKAVKKPQKFLAYGVACGIATLGLTFHGFFSISFGGEQRDKADYFINQYKNDPSSVSKDEEQAYYMKTQKKSTMKTILFGAALGVQGAVLLTNGIYLSVRKHKGISIGDIKVWPSYLLGGLLFAGGTTLIAARSIRYKQLGDLESKTATSVNAVLIRPYYQADPATGSLESGVIGQWSF